MIHVPSTNSHSCQNYFGVGFLVTSYYTLKLDGHRKLGQ